MVWIALVIKKPIKLNLVGGSALHRGSIFASHPGAPSLNPKKLLILLGFINGAGNRKVGSGLKMLFGPI